MFASLALVALLLIATAALGVGWDGAEAQDGGRAVAISAGFEHACALLDSGAVEYWGWNEHGQTDAPSGRVSAGRFHSCGLRESGAVECWGDDEYGQTDAPSGRFSAVSAGGSHSCGLRESGEIECWGYAFDGQAQPPAGRQIQISSGAYHACALSEDDMLSCWMIYNGAADVPAWLRISGLPSTGTGGLLGRGGALPVEIIALVALAASAAVLGLARRRGRRHS